MTKGFEHNVVEHPGGGRSLVGWNLNRWIDGPDKKRPLRIEVTFEVDDPSPAGMPEGAEAHRLKDLEESLAGFMKRRVGATHAMRVAGEGRLTVVFYAAERGGLLRRRDVRETLPRALEQFGSRKNRELTVEFFEDPGWERLMGIFSAHDPPQWHEDRRLLNHLMKQRDAVGARRLVAHRVDFAEQTQCREFLKSARKRLRFKSEGGPRKTGGGVWRATIVRSEPTIATWHIHAVVLDVKALAADNDGTYDGWECELIERTDPAPLAPPGGFKVG